MSIMEKYRIYLILLLTALIVGSCEKSVSTEDHSEKSRITLYSTLKVTMPRGSIFLKKEHLTRIRDTPQWKVQRM